MTLLISVFAAVIATAKWYFDQPENKHRLGILCWLLWGASLMWLVDAVYEYIEIGAAYFTPSPQVMLNDAFLGLSVVALALTIWVIRLIISDPKGVMKDVLSKRKDK